MIDVNDIAALLHVEEKLREHGSRYPNMLKAVAAKLDEYEAEHSPEPAAQPEPTEPEEETSNSDRRV